MLSQRVQAKQRLHELLHSSTCFEVLRLLMWLVLGQLLMMDNAALDIFGDLELTHEASNPIYDRSCLC